MKKHTLSRINNGKSVEPQAEDLNNTANNSIFNAELQNTDFTVAK